MGALHEAGVDAAFLNSTLDFDATQDVEWRLQTGQITLLYAAPERLNTPRFLGLLDSLHDTGNPVAVRHRRSALREPVGHDFRPEYQALTLLHERYPQVPRVALTATADALTRRHHRAPAFCRTRRLFISSFDRPNIRYTIVEKKDATHATAALHRAQSIGRGGRGVLPVAQARGGTGGHAAAMQASTPCPTTPGWTPRCARTTRTAFCARKAS